MKGKPKERPQRKIGEAEKHLHSQNKSGVKSLHSGQLLIQSFVETLPCTSSHNPHDFGAVVGAVASRFSAGHRFEAVQEYLGKWVIEVSLEVKLPTIWTDEKNRWEGSEKRREEETCLKEVSQNCFVMLSPSKLSSSKTEEVSQNSFVFKCR